MCCVHHPILLRKGVSLEAVIHLHSHWSAIFQTIKDHICNLTYFGNHPRHRTGEAMTADDFQNDTSLLLQALDALGETNHVARMWLAEQKKLAAAAKRSATGAP